MAENAKAVKKTRTVFLPLLEGENAPTQEFVSLNFKNYIIRRGEYVEVPEEIAALLDEREHARQAAMKEALRLKVREP